MKINKIIFKRMLPLNAFVGAAISGALWFTVHETKNNIQGDKDKELKVLMIATSSAFFVLGALLLMLFVLDVYYKDVDFASKTARRYIKEIIKNNPELKIFSGILNNPHAIKNVACAISNILRPSEIQQIENILNNGFENLDSEEKTKKVLISKQKEIIDVLKQHAYMHPEFLDQLKIAVAYADKTYIIPSQQKLR